MRLEHGKIILERRECWQCRGTRKVNEWIPCTACKGTGKKGARLCLTCKPQASFKRGFVLSIDTGVCQGCTDGTQAENFGESIPLSVWESLPIKVYRSDRQQTYGEYLLAVGCLWSSTDYGEHKKLTDEQLIAKVRSNGFGIPQASKVCTPEGVLCDHIGIFTNHNGYTPKAVFDTPVAPNGLSVERGIAVGERLASEGLNGTLLAALL